MADKNLVLQLLITAKDQASAALQGIRTSVKTMGDAVSQVLAPLRTFGGLLATAAGIGGAKELADRADAYIRVSNSLKIATSSEEEYQAALKDVAAIAGRTNADIETTAQLYGKVTQSAKELGLSQQQVGQLTEVISKGMQLSGASAATASGAILQLTQAFGSGALRGEEFNSVMEASPELMRQLAAGLGVTIGELRGLAEQGALTSRAVSAALLAQKDAIDQAYGETTRTVGQAFTQLNNQLILYVGQINESTGATATIGAALKLLADNLGVVAAAAGAGLVAALGKSTQALISYAKESIAARAAARDHAIAAAAQRDAALAAAQGNVAAAQAAVNRAIAEQRAAQAALQAAAGDEAVTRARAAAAAAAQTATAATNRYITAQSALNTAQAASATGAGLLSRALGFLAGPGGLILLAVSAFGALLPLLGKSKTDLDALTISTDQYKTSLQGLNEAQLLANIQQLNEGIQEQAETVRDAEAQVNHLRDGHRNLFEVLRDGRPVMEQLTEAEGKLADARQKLAQLQTNLTVSTEALRLARQQEDQDLGQQFARYAQIQTAMEKYGQQLEALGKQQNALAKTNQDRIQSELDLAKATGDVQAVERLTLALAQEKAAAARQQAELDRAAAAAARIKLEAVQKEYDLTREKTPKDEKALRLARQDVEVKNAQAAASEAAARYFSAMANGARDLGAAQAAVVDTEVQLWTALRNEAEQSARLAQAKGNEYEARQQLVRVAEIEARLAQLNAEQKRIEADATVIVLKTIQDEIQDKLALGEVISDVDRARLQAATNAMEAAAIEAQAAGLVAEAEARKAAAAKLAGLGGKDKTDSNNQVADSEQRVAGFVEQSSLKLQENAQASGEASEGAGALAKVIASQIGYWREETAALSAATAALFEWNIGFSKIDPQYGRQVFGSISDAADQAGSKIGELTGYIREMSKAMLFSSGDLGYFMAQINQAGARAQKAYYEQKLEAEKLEVQLAKVGETGGRAFASLEAALGFVQRTSEQTRNALWLLNQQDMDQLQAALDGATQKLQEMQQATQSAKDELAAMNAELLEAQGMDQKAAMLREQLEYQQRLADLEQQRRQAEAAGNRELLAILDQQLQMLERIHAAKQRNLAADARSGSARVPPASSGQATGSGAGSGGGNSGVTVNVNASNARLLDNQFVQDLARQLSPIFGNMQRRLN